MSNILPSYNVLGKYTVSNSKLSISIPGFRFGSFLFLPFRLVDAVTTATGSKIAPKAFFFFLDGYLTGR